MIYKVSVIVPIYSVERFIARAVDTMMRQTLTEVEFVFVDDCTPDNSIDILQDVISRYPSRKNDIQIIRNGHNMGLPASRNIGLKVARGEYVFHWDSDDYAEIGMLEEMYDFAKRYNVDVVWTDWFLTFEKSERYMRQPSYPTAHEALRGMLGGAMKYNVWNKLVRRSIYIDNNIEFPSGFGMGEDLTMLLVFAFARKVRYLNRAYYHYLKINTQAFSHNIKPEHFGALKRNVSWITAQLRELKGESIDDELAFLKLESKYPLIAVSGDFAMYRLWNEWFPEANEYIGKNGNIGMRSRILQKLAYKKQYWALWIHYQLVIRFIYGVIYR